MISNRLAAGLAGALLAMSSLAPAPADPPKGRQYPPARKGDTVDDYHGMKVADPYRWLEDIDSDETRAWVEAQVKLTDAHLERIPARGRIKERLTKLWDYEKFGLPAKEGDRYFFTYNSGLQNQGVLYSAASLDAEPKALLDPNKLSADGTVAIAQGGLAISDDGKLLAYGLASAGSDWQEWRVREVASGADRDDVLKWIKFATPAWTKDGTGFYYARFPKPGEGQDLKATNYDQKLYYHKLGTKQDYDSLVYERPDRREWQFHPTVSDDGRYLINTVSKGTDDKYRIVFKDLEQAGSEFVELIDNFDHEYTFVDNVGPVFYFKTDLDAPRKRLVAIDTSKSEAGKPAVAEVIPQAEETLLSVNLVGDRFITNYLKDARSLVRVYDRQGKHVRDVDLPGLGTAVGFGGKRSDRETFYAFNSFIAPPTIYRYDVASGRSEVYKRPKVDFNPDDYETKQVFYASKDGTRIPMFLSHKKGIALDGKNPTYLYGYGGFNIPLSPAFSPSTLAWMELGGVFASANLRGGGEYGEAWHKAGTKLQKQHVFDDFIAAAEWLIANKYTSTPRLAIEGRSNGGLLIGAVLNQRPDLFGAAVPGVGVMDMLRFHKFTIGWAWTDDYGSSDDPEQFKALHAYSPLHNIKAGACYPPTLVITADHDDRVYPAHSFKYATALQAAQSCDNPVLIRIETKAGHGAGKPTAKIIEEAADKWAFLVKALGMPGGADPFR